MRISLTDRINVMLTEQGYTYSNWLYIDDDVQAVVEAGLDGDGLMGVEPEGIDMVALSHYHLDHTRGDRLFSRAVMAIHESETDTLTDVEELYRRNSLDEWGALMPEADFEQSYLELNYPGPQNGLTSLAGDAGVMPLRDGQILDFGRTRAQVMLTPGHTAGHCCFWFPEEDILFCGDICLTRVGPWYGEHTADPAALMRSIDRVLELKPGRLVSAHRHQIVETPTAVLEEFKSRIPMREERVWRSVREAPCDIQELAGRNLIYPSHPQIFVEFWEKLMLNKHLQRLKEQGLAETDGTVWAGR